MKNDNRNGKQKPDPNQVIGKRPLTAEERANAEFYGLREEFARNYTTAQLEDLANDWMLTRLGNSLGC